MGLRLFFASLVGYSLWWIAMLNQEQQEAVEAVDGPVLILAGAGTGKTKTITHRIAHIIENSYAEPQQILAVTFTNKAASEMLNRVSRMIDVSGIWLGTFHAIASRILRQHAALVGLKNDFTIVNTDDQMQILKSIIRDLCPEYLSDSGHKVIMNSIQRWKDRGLLPKSITETEIRKPIHRTAASVYREYQDRLKFLNAADFGDLLMYNVCIFTDNQDVLSHYQQKFRYVMVDEYQDTNTIQYLWLRLLAQKHQNICCVGDDDQSIYSWRGAEIGNILKFSDDFPGAKIIRLECNYRSTSNILAVASAIINHNTTRLDKTLWTANGEGRKISLVKFFDSKAEARYIVESIRNLQDYRFNDIAILVRAGFQTRVFEEYFLQHRVPYRIVGGTKFYDRQEIRDLIAYLRVIANSSDGIAFERVLGKPRKNIGEVTIKKMYCYAIDANLPMLDAAREMVSGSQIAGKASGSLKLLLDKIDSWRDSLSELSVSRLMERIYHESGYHEMLENEGEEASARIENIKELFCALLSFETVESFLEHISLVSDADQFKEDDSYVYMMTLHAAKGLEFPVVFLPGWEEGTFPTEKALDDPTGRPLEEERRLAYVGVTRAKERLFISCSATRFKNNWQQPMRSSRFLRELPMEHVEELRRV